jgi:hypothetical protein
MERLVPNIGQGGGGLKILVEMQSFLLCLVRLFCLTRPILPPEIFESGKNIGLDPLLLDAKSSKPLSQMILPFLMLQNTNAKLLTTLLLTWQIPCQLPGKSRRTDKMAKPSH